MKIIKKLRFAALAALAALAVTLLFQIPTMLADNHGQKGHHGQRGGDNKRGDPDHGDARVTLSRNG